MFERFTDRARRVCVLAQEESRMLKHDYIGTEHLLLGMIREGEGIAARAFQIFGADREWALTYIGEGEGTPSGHIPFTAHAKKTLELALREALQLGHNYIGTEHLLLALIRLNEGGAAEVLSHLEPDLNSLRSTVMLLIEGPKPEVKAESEPEVHFYTYIVTPYVVLDGEEQHMVFDDVLSHHFEGGFLVLNREGNVSTMINRDDTRLVSITP